jgi:hypothetical protein
MSISDMVTKQNLLKKTGWKTHSNRKKMLVIKPVDDFYALLLTDIY